MGNNEQEGSLSDVDMLRRENFAAAERTEQRFNKLEELIEEQDRLIASMIAVYAELSSIVNTAMDTLYNFTWDDETQTEFERRLKTVNSEMISIMEGISESGLEDRDPVS